MRAGSSGSMLERVDWTHTTRTFKALGHRFAVRSTDQNMGQLFDDLYAPCAVAGPPQTWYSIVQQTPGARERELYVDSERIMVMDRPSWLVRYMAWHVNHQVIKRSSGYVLLHAAAAAHDGVGVLLPGAPEAGKTTLVAGLIRSGFSYLTDEAAAIDPETLQIEPYPKPLTIDRGSWPVLPDLAPVGADTPRGYHEGQWHVSPATLRADAISGRVSAAVIVFPRFEAGAATTLEPLGRAEALVALLDQTFRLHQDGRRNLDVLARVVKPVDCYRLTSGDLDEACELVLKVTDRALAARDEEWADGKS